MSTWTTTDGDDGIRFEKNECETEMTWNIQVELVEVE